MTYQTSPYRPWIFPDEAYYMNQRGIQQLKPVPIPNGYDPLPGGGSEAQRLFDNHDRNVALERVRINKKKKEGMLGLLNTTARSQRYERSMSRSAVPNGVFEGSPMEYVTSGGLRGGRIYTKEGQEWLAKRLLQRREEYAQLSSGKFTPGTAKQIELSSFSNIDTLLQIAFTALTSGTISGSLNDTLNQLLQALIKAGATITQSQLTKYAQAVQRMGMTAESYTEANIQRREDAGILPQEFNEASDVKQMSKLRAVQKTLGIIDAAIREIARVINSSRPAREQVMSTLASRLFSRQLEQFAAPEGVEPYPEMQFGPIPGVQEDILPFQEEEEVVDEMPELQEGEGGLFGEYDQGLFGEGRRRHKYRY
jgi:hypothetical protein